MLLDLSGADIGPFREPFCLQMRAKSLPELAWSLLPAPGAGDVLPVAALYGANASGKSSVFWAAHALRRIIHNGRLPFLTDIPRPDKNAPAALRIAFADPDRGIGYCRYVLSFFPAGHPPVPEADRRPRVTEEGLRMSFLGEQCLYTRAGDIAPEDEGLLGLASVFYEAHPDAAGAVRQSVSRGLITGSGGSKRFHRFDCGEPLNLVNAWIQEAADLAGIPGTFRAELSKRGPQLVVLSGDSDRQPAELAVSPGTIRFLTLMPEVRHALRTGGTLFADHIDSLHPDLFAQILPLFRNAETNPRHAQLVFASQNPALLDEDILRRDEIMLVSRNRDTVESTLYPLSDFSVAPGSYEHRYLSGRYGAVPPAGILFSADGERREERKGKETEIL